MIRKISVILAIFYTLATTAQTLISLAVFLALLATGSALTPYNIFLVFSYNSAIKEYVSFYLANGSTRVIECFMSAGRIQEFLETVDTTLEQQHGIFRTQLEFPKEPDNMNQGGAMLREERVLKGKEEQRRTARYETPEGDRSQRVVPLVAITNMSCSINDNESPKSILRSINFHVKGNKLVVITGPVGCGKSSLLLSILGELPTNQGQLTRQGNVAFVSQAPWVFSGTLRDNILLNNPYDPQRYSQVTKVCALEKDIVMFPDGDMTMLGERGAVLSGGQRARISLARAVYSDADLYLLDDSLSAIDAEVAHHIFEQCISQLLSGRLCILATHQLLYLKYADHVVLMNRASIEWEGSYAEMLQSRGQRPVDSDREMENTNENRERTEDGGQDSKHPQIGKEEESLAVVEEDRDVGSVSYRTYWQYLKEGCFTGFLVPLALILVFAQGESHG